MGAEQIDSRAPYHRLDRAGLVLLIGDNRITGLEEDSATLQSTTGAIQTYRRADPGGSALVWELAGADQDEERVDREEQATKLHDYTKAKGVNVTLQLIGEEETGAEHCQHDNPTLGQEYMADWLADQFGIDQRQLLDLK